MRFWFARGSQVPIREQLITQVVLGILSGDLAPGQRLPSTRDLARRFRLHSNTVSAGYRKLERDGWVELRHGSGVYVCDKRPEAAHTAASELDTAITHVFQTARKLEIPFYEVRSRLRQWLELQPPDHFLLIEPDEDLRRIVMAEMQRAVTLPVRGCSLGDASSSELLEGAISVVLPSKAVAVRRLLPAEIDLLTLHVRSVPDALAKYLPAPSGLLIGVASHWSDFLDKARTMLIAAGFDSESLVLRNAQEASWQKGLEQTAVVVCDALTATELPGGCRVASFSLLTEASLLELKRIQQFVCGV